VVVHPLKQATLLPNNKDLLQQQQRTIKVQTKRETKEL